MGFDVNGKAPGKILWIGGYSVLERPNISFVTAVDAYVNVNVKSLEGNKIIVDVPQLRVHVEGTVDLKSGALSLDVPKELVLLKTSMEVALWILYPQEMKGNCMSPCLRTCASGHPRL